MKAVSSPFTRDLKIPLKSRDTDLSADENDSESHPDKFMEVVREVNAKKPQIMPFDLDQKNQ